MKRSKILLFANNIPSQKNLLSWRYFGEFDRFFSEIAWEKGFQTVYHVLAGAPYRDHYREFYHQEILIHEGNIRVGYYEGAQGPSRDLLDSFVLVYEGVTEISPALGFQIESSPLLEKITK